MLPFVLSARSAGDLLELAGRVAARRPGDAGLPLARELAARADPADPYRAVLAAADLPRAPAVVGTPRPRPVPGRLAVLYSGQSSQRPGMGAGLGRRFPGVATTIDDVLARIDPGLRDVVASGVGLDRPEHAQPALLAVALAVHGLLDEVGVRPDLVCGHSFGEVAAAACTGVWTVPDACALVATRGRLIGALPAGGGMIAVEAGEAEVAAALPGPPVALSAIHSPDSVVVAGPLEQVREVAAVFAARGRRTTDIGVDVAAHSPAMEPVLAPLAAAVRAAGGRPGPVPLVGNATGAVVDPAALAGPEHWVTHCRETVRWADVVATLVAEGATTFLEVGPSGVLGRLAAACLPEADRDAGIPAVTADPDEATAFLDALVRLDARGHAVDWAALLDAGRW